MKGWTMKNEIELRGDWSMNKPLRCPDCKGVDKPKCIEVIYLRKELSRLQSKAYTLQTDIQELLRLIDIRDWRGLRMIKNKICLRQIVLPIGKTSIIELCVFEGNII